MDALSDEDLAFQVERLNDKEDFDEECGTCKKLNLSLKTFEKQIKAWNEINAFLNIADIKIW